jgi:serine/threonine protein phosphatase PrpC
MLRVSEQYAATDTGRQRRANEDSMLTRSPLFVVADGMGGAQAGEVASRLAVESFHEGLDPAGGAEQELAVHVQAANARIHELSQSDSEHAGMGTTLTAAYAGEQEVAIANVGDSRVYCLRDGELLRLTDDHSLVDELIRQGKLTPEEAEDHPQRSIITRALGPEPTVEVDTRSYRARPGDVYMLCSDGLTTMVPERRLAEVLVAHPRLRDAGEALIAAANEAGGRDNITVVLFRLEEVELGGVLGLDQHTTLTGVSAADWGAPAWDDGSPGQGGAPPGDTPPGRPVVTAMPSASRRPRRPTHASPRSGSRSRLRRRLVPSVAVLVVLGLLAGGAYVASQSVYFIGTNSRGLVTVFRGVPYSLPGPINLYSRDFVSGVSASSLSTGRRQTLLNHTLRSEEDATSLIRGLEQGQVSGSGG